MTRVPRPPLALPSGTTGVARSGAQAEGWTRGVGRRRGGGGPSARAGRCRARTGAPASGAHRAAPGPSTATAAAAVSALCRLLRGTNGGVDGLSGCPQEPQRVGERLLHVGAVPHLILKK